MRAVVFGGSGLLGRHLVAEIKRCGFEVIAPSHQEVPIEDLDKVEKAIRGATYVFNAAGYTDVEKAEKESTQAFQCNSVGPRKIALATKKENCTFIQISTEFVFDGDGDGLIYSTDEPNPLSTYAFSKWCAENAAEKLTTDYQIIRLQSLYGRGGKNYHSKLLGLIQEGCKDLVLDGERLVQPTWAGDAANGIVQIALQGILSSAPDKRVWHVGSNEPTTWFKFGEQMATMLKKPFHFKSVPLSYFNYTVNRPLRLTTTVDVGSHWTSGLRSYLESEGL